MGPYQKNVVNITEPNQGFENLSLEKFSFVLIHKNTRTRWSKFSPYSSAQNLVKNTTIKFAVIIF